MASLANRSSALCNVLMLANPRGSDRVQSMRTAVGGAWDGFVACRALRQSSGVALQIDALNVVVWYRGWELGMRRSMTGFALQSAMAL